MGCARPAYAGNAKKKIGRLKDWEVGFWSPDSYREDFGIEGIVPLFLPCPFGVLLSLVPKK